ncbi:MAG TPA: competence protein CoiA family protein [Bacillales bacterium]
MAKREDGTLFSLLDRRGKSELLGLRRRESFFCPVCNGSVRMRLGNKVSWHFAHIKGMKCSFETEAESAYHLNGKKLLYEWLVSQNVKVKLEPYLPLLKQRPDLMLHTYPHQTALEFQCSAIDPDLLIKRTETYQEAGLIPVWILGGNRLKRTGRHIFQIPQMDWLTLRKASQTDANVFLLYFCPDNKQFAILSDIIPYNASKVLANVQYLPMSKLSFHDLYRASQSGIFLPPASWLKVKERWRMNAFRSRTYSFLYVRKLFGNLSLIPPAAGWPTPHLYRIETPVFLWQSWLFHRFFLKWPAEQPITLKRVRTAFRNLVHKGIFQIRQFPLIPDFDETPALLDYLRCLEHFGFFRRIDENTFTKVPGLSESVSTVDEFSRLDCEYFEKLDGIF